MSNTESIILVLLFFATSVVGVVTGSNSLVTVPVMFQFGIDAKTAIATNMFGLTFMSVGATIPFLKTGKIDRQTVTPLIVLTLFGSALGAALVIVIAPVGLKLIVSVAMIAVTVFSILNRKTGIVTSEPTPARTAAVYFLTFALGIYGGLYSGGYVTMLTAVYVALFGMTFTESVAATKIVNVASSAIATAVFMWQGLVDYKLGLILAVTMFSGAYIGAHTVTKMNDVWLKRIFVTVVLALAIKTILDFGS